MANAYLDVAIATTETITGESIEETLGYVSAIDLNYFLIRKNRAAEASLNAAMEKLQHAAFKAGADAVVGVRTNLELQSQFWGFTRISVFIEGTCVKLK